MTGFDSQDTASDLSATSMLSGCEHHNSFYLMAPIDLRDVSLERLTLPKFWLGQTVIWAQVSTHGFGKILGLVFANGVNVEAQGYHYLVLFSPDNPSPEVCLADWAFEDDLELYQPQVAAPLPNPTCVGIGGG